MARITTHGVSDYSDFVIDEIVARCSDDLHGRSEGSIADQGAS
jgi:hypothetical protein